MSTEKMDEIKKPTLELLKSFALGAGDILRSAYGKKHTIRHKGKTDLVTEVDQRSEDYILEQIRKDFAHHSIICEESGFQDGSSHHCWFVDPLDGTTNFAHNLPIFSVSIAYAVDGQLTLGVVYDPMRDELFSAERGRGAWLNEQPLRVSNIQELSSALLITGFAYEAEGSQQESVGSRYFVNVDYFSRFMTRAQSIRRLGSAAIDLAYVAAGRADGFWELKLGAWDVAAGALIVREAGGLVSDLQGNEDFLKPPHSIVAANPFIHPLMLPVFR